MCKNRYRSTAKVLCIILCFSFIIMSASSVVFAGKNTSKYDDRKYTSDRCSGPIFSSKSGSIQTLILDSMESKKNNEIANLLSACDKKNLAATSKSIAGILKGTWNSKKGEADLRDILSDYLGFTPKAKLAITMIIREGYSGVVIPRNLSNKIRLKINGDITGNQRDNHGIMFMVKALQILQKVASIENEKIVTLKLDNYLRVKFSFNRLENYSYITSSMSEVLNTMNSLPFKKKDFKTFIEYYEKYLNSCSLADGISFLYLLRDNNIPYAIDIK